MAAQAQKWADSCPSMTSRDQHSRPGVDRTGGENLAWSRASSFDVTATVMGWFDQLIKVGLP